MFLRTVESGPHAGGWSAHCGAVELFVVAVRKLEDFILHDNFQSGKNVGWDSGAERIKSVSGGDGCIHRDSIASEEAGGGWEDWEGICLFGFLSVQLLKEFFIRRLR
jgi:hypothetical protein